MTKGRADKAYSQLWDVVDGAVNDAFHKHDDYLTSKGRRSARTSVVKRVTGTVLGFALQEAKRQRELAVKDVPLAKEERQAGALLEAAAGAGDTFSSALPSSHCRIGRIRFKRRSRYRSPQAFDLKTNELIAAVGYARTLSQLAGRGA